MTAAAKRNDAIDPYVKAVLRRRLRKRPGRRLPKPSKPLHPRSVQNYYFSELQGILRGLEHVLKGTIFSSLQSILKEANAMRPASGKRQDAYDETVKSTINKGKIQFFQLVNVHKFKNIAEKVGARTNDFNKKDVGRVFKSVLGIDLFHAEPWLDQEMKAFVKQNVSYITSIPEEFFGRIEHTILRSARAGRLVKDVQKDLEKDYDITSRRAALIARDQVSKFNSNLTQLRHRQVGVEKYTWSTSNDERVRDLHQEREGEVFSWDDPPSETDDDGPPGEPINCRCSALPVFEEEEEEGDESEED